ncbi:MAG TPA: hypothetical protein VKB53_08935 [Gammaproteobacteria bacterium]|jgi:hypothetical protein|nr:hypothetical protein [Gammaproteobacteria bacterium]HKH20990.1 hypothetical protein [Gammaproteobacteria bacterium]
MRGITLLAALIALMALAGYIMRPASLVASNSLYALAVIFTLLLLLGLARLA